MLRPGTNQPPAAPGEPQRDAPADAELLADAVEALEAGCMPAEFALEELLHLVRQRAAVDWALRRRCAVRAFEAERAAGRSRVQAAGVVARRLFESRNTIMGWARAARPAPSEGA